jgi:prepilin-type processing-associated H-X9-DG protein
MNTVPAATIEGRRRLGGFNRLELLLVAGVLVMVGLVTLAVLRCWKPRAASASCLGNLSTIGTAFWIFRQDHAGQFPMRLSTNQGGSLEWTAGPEAVRATFLTLEGVLPSPKSLACPLDDRQPSRAWASLRTSNISYFIAVTVLEPGRYGLLSGDRQLTATEGLVRSGFLTNGDQSRIRWSPNVPHAGAGNILHADGRVEAAVTGGKLKELLAHPRNRDLRIALPEPTPRSTEQPGPVTDNMR